MNDFTPPSRKHWAWWLFFATLFLLLVLASADKCNAQTVSKPTATVNNMHVHIAYDKDNHKVSVLTPMKLFIRGEEINAEVTELGGIPTYILDSAGTTKLRLDYPWEESHNMAIPIIYGNPDVYAAETINGQRITVAWDTQSNGFLNVNQQISVGNIPNNNGVYSPGNGLLVIIKNK